MPCARPRCYPHTECAGLRAGARLHFNCDDLRSRRPRSFICTLAADDLFPGRRSVVSRVWPLDQRATRRERPVACRGRGHERAPCPQRRRLCCVRSARFTGGGKPLRPSRDRIASGDTARNFGAGWASRPPEGVEFEAPGPAVQTGVARFPPQLPDPKSSGAPHSPGRDRFGE